MTRFLSLALLFLVSCGSVKEVSLKDPEADRIVEGRFAVLFASTFGAPGQVLVADFDQLDHFVNLGLPNLGSEAQIKMQDGLLYILHAGAGYSVGSSDNLQVIDVRNGAKTLHQFSTGLGTNPRDFIIANGKAFISLYDSARDIRDANGHPADVIVMDLQDGSKKGISFSAYLQQDGFKQALATRMIEVGDKIYVCLQDLGSTPQKGDIYDHNAPGKIGIIDVNTEQEEGVILLRSSNPIDLAYSEADEKLYVISQAKLEGTHSFYQESDKEGLEIIPLKNGEPLPSFFISDDDLGGYLDGIVKGDSQIYLALSRSKTGSLDFGTEVMGLDFDMDDLSSQVEMAPFGLDVRAMAFDSKGRLWVSRRQVESSEHEVSKAYVEVYDTLTRKLIKVLSLPQNLEDVPVVAITMGN